MNKDLQPRSSFIGTPGEDEVVRPDVLAFIARDDQAVRQQILVEKLDLLTKLEASKVPTGLKSFSWTITDNIHEIQLGTPWISFTLINNGAGTVYIKVNQLEGPLTSERGIASGSTVSVDFDYPIITKIFLVAASGTTAAVTIDAEEGKWA